MLNMLKYAYDIGVKLAIAGNPWGLPRAAMEGLMDLKFNRPAVRDAGVGLLEKIKEGLSEVAHFAGEGPSTSPAVRRALKELETLRNKLGEEKLATSR